MSPSKRDSLSFIPFLKSLGLPRLPIIPFLESLGLPRDPWSPFLESLGLPRAPMESRWPLFGTPFWKSTLLLDTDSQKTLGPKKENSHWVPRVLFRLCLGIHIQKGRFLLFLNPSFDAGFLFLTIPFRRSFLDPFLILSGNNRNP